MLRGGIKLFTIRGIEIRLDYSWFIIFILVTWSLAAQYFPLRYPVEDNPGWTETTYWVLGIITSVLFFLSVLAHELSHSFVAQAFGTKVPRITLFIFGGAAQIAEEPKSAKAELLMAIAGPLCSVAIGGGSALLWYFLRDVYSPAGALLGWLALINVMLAVFNLIPGFPLDGGRVLRALVWAATRDADKATRIAAGIGRGIAFMFILFGVFLIFRGQMFDGIWIAFIGWFLLQAATTTSRRQTLHSLLEGHKAGEVMWTDCPMVEAGETVQNLVYDKILHTGRRCFPVLKDQRVSGVVTVHNVQSVSTDQWPHTSVEQVMIPAESLKVVSPDTPLRKVMDMMSPDGVNQVPVVDNGRFVGMVTREGLMDFIRAKSELGI